MKAEADEAWNNEFDLVFTNELGRYITMHQLYNHNKSTLERAGVEHHRLHDLRDTFAVTSLQAGDDIKTVQENLGHADASFTLNVYIKSLENMKKKSASNMQSFFEEQQKPDKGK